MNKKNQYLFPLILVTSLFFLWAFLHNINPILIPHLKKALQLSDTQSSYVDSPAAIAYFIMAVPAGLFMHRYGYKKGIILGLFLFAVGALLVVPAASIRSFPFFLFAIFVSATGATFLETVANPYVSILGDKETSEQRLNFAQSFNGIGAFLAPIIGGRVILSGIEHSKEELSRMSPDALNVYLQSEADTVKLPYTIIGIVVLLLMVAFFFTRLPEVKADDSEVHGPTEFSVKVLRHRHVLWAVIAQFFYVGAQVGVGSFFIRYSKFVADINEKEAAVMWGSIAMVGFMVGRFVGTFLMRSIKPARLLTIYTLISILLLLAGLFLKGTIAVYCIAAVPFFMSIMFPTIFALGIKGLGEETKIASSFIVMAIIGGAGAPILMGMISDSTGSIQNAYIVPLVCFLAVLYFGLSGHKLSTQTVREEQKELV